MILHVKIRISSFIIKLRENIGIIIAITLPTNADKNHKRGRSFKNKADSFIIMEFKNKFIKSVNSISISIFSPCFIVKHNVKNNKKEKNI